MKTLKRVIFACGVLFFVGSRGVQVIGDRLDLNELAVTAGLEQKYGTFMLDIVPALTVYDLKVALAKREHIPIEKMSIVVARQVLEDNERIQEVIREVTDNKIYLRLGNHRPVLMRPIDRVRYNNRWNQL